MGIRYNQAPISQTSLITIPNHGTTSTTFKKPTPKSGEEAFQTEISRLRNEAKMKDIKVKRLESKIKENLRKETKPATVETGREGSKHQGSGGHKPGNSNPRRDEKYSRNNRTEPEAF